VFLMLFKVELFWMMIVVARVGSGLIAKDLKARALPIYFAKPVTPLNYLAGKWLVVASFIALSVLVPNLLTLVIGTILTGGLGSWGETIGLGLNLLLGGLGICVAGGTILLDLSSLTSDHRYVVFGWLAVCLLPAFAQAIVNEELPRDVTGGWLGCISLRSDALVVLNWLLGMPEVWAASPLPEDGLGRLMKPVEPACAGVVLGACVVIAILVCYRQVVRFSRSAANV
jgi:hypothetical protein